ncbi:hypothetical protein QE152_g25518 [Popillia japonica]|uniref:Nuclease HARBI1 n=1 Tax=Popillia japonica TaxID=7064 RepID=A0AAW1K2H4_POPJA
MGILANVLLEEEDEDDSLLLSLSKSQRSNINKILESRKEEGCHNTLITRHLMDDETKFHQYFRLSKTQFFEVLSYIENDITKTPNTFVNEPISACQPLCLTLRYLATEESFRSMSFNYRISHNHISLIIRDVLTTICEKLMPIYLFTNLYT